MLKKQKIRLSILMVGFVLLLGLFVLIFKVPTNYGKWLPLLAAIGWFILFIILSFALFSTVLQLHNRTTYETMKQSPIVIKQNNYLQEDAVCSKLLDDRFILKDKKDLPECSCALFRRVEHNKGDIIDDFYLINNITFALNMQKVSAIVDQMSNEVNSPIIRQKCTFIIVYSQNATKKDISDLIAHMNYTFAVIVPIVIQKDKVYYSPIPQNKHFAKGKALKHAIDIINSYC